ncbi:hypothetical protein K5M33_14060 [Chromobacterium vaccinii]|nr:hypothetical protein [Chromobacterium vaccinii]MBX9357848.1 hypothetical protein [Chromobacterium vaccinii]
MNTSNPITAQVLLSMPSHGKSTAATPAGPRMCTFPFNPAASSCLLPAAEILLREVGDDLIYSDDANQACLMGMLEGELAFALSVNKDSPSRTLTQCKSQLLLRLGLEGDTLTLEQLRLRGWIIGLLESVATALDPDDWDNPTTA